MRQLLASFFAFALAALPAPAASTHSAAPHARSDAAIEQTLHAKLAKSKIGKDGFQVHVKEGVATWEGHTSVMQHKGAATRMAKSAGATSVVNHIHIDGAARPGQPIRKASVTP
jgi:osmotically-inducible protein OsmY